MQVQSEIQDYVQRPGRYSNIDGTGEMYFGVMFLGFALIDYLQSMLPADSIWIGKNWHQLVFMPVLLAVLGLGWWGIKAVKRYITYPRTGYVALNTGTWKRLLFMLSGGGVAVALYVVVFYGLRHSAVSLRHIGIFILWEAPYVAIACMSRDHPWKWFVALIMALGFAAIEFAVPGSVLDRLRPSLFLGLIWLTSGGITLYLYIQRTHPPTVEPE